MRVSVSFRVCPLGSPALLPPTLLLYAMLAVAVCPQLALSLTPHYDRSDPPRVLLVSFDGFRADYLDWWGSEQNTPNLFRVRREGCSAHHLNNVFLTKTFGNHYSLTTGVYQETHGVVANSFYDPTYGELGVDNGTVFWDYNQAVVPIWLLNEGEGGGRVSGGMMWPGSSSRIQGKIPHYTQSWNRSMPWEERVEVALGWMARADSPANLVLLYFEEPDRSGHAYGPNSTEVQNAVYRVDNITGHLLRRMESLGLLREVNLVIVSDHGMQELKQERILNVSQVLQTVPHRTFAASPIMHILPDHEEDIDKMYAALSEAAKSMNFTAYKKTEMPLRWHYNNTLRVSPIVLVADEGYGFQDLYQTIDYYNKAFNLTPSPERVYGIHGYDDTLHSMHPFFMARGPGIKQGYRMEEFSSLDVYPLLCNLLGLRPAPNNGSLAEVAGMLRVVATQGVGWADKEWVVAGIVLLSGVVLFALVTVAVKAMLRRRRAPTHTDHGYRQLNWRNDNNGDGGKNEEEEQHLLVPAATEDV